MQCFPLPWLSKSSDNRSVETKNTWWMVWMLHESNRIIRCWTFCFAYIVTRIYLPASGQAVATGVAPSPPRFLAAIFIAHKIKQSDCLSIFHRVLLIHALAFSENQLVHNKSPPIYTSMHSGGFEITKLIYTRFEDNLTRHRDDRLYMMPTSFRKSRNKVNLSPRCCFC